MFSKTIIYLLFPTIFSSMSLENVGLEKNKESQQISNQEVIELGVERIKMAFETISFEELTKVVNSDLLFNRDNAQKTTTQTRPISELPKNKCSSTTKEKNCIN